MNTAHRQQSRAKRSYTADPSAIYRLMNRIQLFTPVELVKLQTPVRMAFESLRTGRGEENNFQTLAAVVNVTLIRSESIDQLCVETCQRAQDALMAVLSRSKRLGKARQRLFTADCPLTTVGFRVATPAQQGVAWQGVAGLGGAGLGGARQGKARAVYSRLSIDNSGLSGGNTNTARRGAARRSWARHGRARHGKARQLLLRSEMTTATKSDTRLNIITRRVVINGLTPIMFDRYAGDNKTRLEWTQKIYLKDGTQSLCIPVLNLASFFTAHNTNSAPKRLRDKREYKGICNAILSFVNFTAPDGDAENIPLLRAGEPIMVGNFTDRKDAVSGLYLHRAVARLDKGIPNPKERPVLPLPWALEFDLTIYPNKEIKEQEIKNLLSEGGMAIGLGTFRGVFGKFEVAKWE